MLGRIRIWEYICFKRQGSFRIRHKRLLHCPTTSCKSPNLLIFGNNFIQSLLVMKKILRRYSPKVLIFIFSLLVIQSADTKAQQVGASFSYFLPTNGYFSTPVAPLSFKDLGVRIGDHIAITTGFTLYRFNGMNVTGMDFETKDPIMGPFFSIIVPGTFKLILPSERFKFEAKAGGFVFYNLGNHIMYGNFDRGFRRDRGWTVANADLQYDNKFGYGYRMGASLTYYVKKNIGIVFGYMNYNGSATLNLRGSVTGLASDGNKITQSIDYAGSKLDFRGHEISLGVDYKMK